MDASTGDYYRRLRLPRNASRQEIKTAFRQLARLYHPASHPQATASYDGFHALKEAYEVLIDRVQRQRYDQVQQGFGRCHLPDNLQTPTDYYLSGIQRATHGQYQAALKDFSQAVALDNRFAEAYLRRAEMSYAIGDDPGVLTDCQRAIALNESEAKSYFFQGQARYRLGYVQSAIAAFTEAIRYDCEEASYYHQRGLAYQDLKEFRLAKKDLKRAAHLYRQQGDLVTCRRLQRLVNPRRYARIRVGAAMKPLRQLLNRLVQALIPAKKSAASLSPPPAGTLPRHSSSPSISPPETTPLTRSAEQSSPQIHASKPSRSEGETYWTPGISSRTGLKPPTHRSAYPLVSGAKTILRLLSNPAGEMFCVYHQLEATCQVTAVGYGLAVLANLCFVLGAIQYFEAGTWLVASWLWAAGGLTYVAMLLVMASARLWKRVHGLWVADIFILGTAMVPLGLLATASGYMRLLASQFSLPLVGLLAHIGVLVMSLWALSQALLTIYSGLTRIHGVTDRVSSWFTPLVLGLGIGAGMVTWGVLA